MSVDRELLAAYLRQRAEFGERDVFLESFDRVEVLELLRGRRTLAPSAEPVGGAAPSVEPARGAAPSAEPERTSASGEPAADGARALSVLAQEAAGCVRCGLSTTRTHVVFGDGTAAAEIVVVGEAPGADEDRTGVPFVGRAGRMLDLLLASVGFPRERVYICNVLKCRPPGNRDPSPDEVAECAPYLKRQIELIRPRALLAVGRFAAQSLTGSDAPMARMRGRIHSYEGVPVVATYHPAYLLRSPDQVRKCWDDVQLLRRVFDGHD